jgi:hypothetical protein
MGTTGEIGVMPRLLTPEQLGAVELAVANAFNKLDIAEHHLDRVHMALEAGNRAEVPDDAWFGMFYRFLNALDLDVEALGEEARKLRELAFQLDRAAINASDA